MNKNINKSPIISIENLTFAYNKNSPVLKNINLDIFEKDFLGIIGPNGSGKSTLIKLMVGLLPLQKGEIKLFGEEIKKFNNWPFIGYVSQKAHNFDTRFPATVKEVVTMGRIARSGLFHGLSREDFTLAENALEEVEMKEFIDRPLHDLSGGQQQRVFIARALAGSPKLLILDEPTIGVDIATQEKFYKLLKKLRQEKNLTIILISHDIDVIANEANVFACLNQELIYHGEPKNFIKEDYLEKLYGKDLKLILHGH